MINQLKIYIYSYLNNKLKYLLRLSNQILYYFKKTCINIANKYFYSKTIMLKLAK